MKFDRFLQEACPPLNLEWRKYRRRSARHRVDARLMELGIDSYGGYLEMLRSEPREAALLPDLMRVTVTRFFREERTWRDLKDLILPGLLSGTDATRPLQAWSAG